MMFDVYGNLAMDLGYSADPVVSDSQMALYLNSTFFSAVKGYSTPKTAITDLIVDPSTSGNIQARLSRYTADSLLKTMYESERMRYTIT
jgi:hypothetical protein